MTKIVNEVSKVLNVAIIRYSRVWEDWRPLTTGLQLQENDDVISITSAGDNVLNLLLQKPRSITAIDMNFAQNALLELKIAAIVQLEDYNQFVELLGIKPSQRRLELYNCLVLSEHTKAFWDDKLNFIENGLSSCGKLESFIEKYPMKHLVHCVSEDDIDRFLNAKNLEEQRMAFEALPLNEIESLQSWYLSREQMSKSARDPVQYKYVQNQRDDKVWERFCYVCRNVPVWNNIYLDLFLRGPRATFEDVKHKLPPYLQENNFIKLKGLVGRIHVVTNNLEDYLVHSPPEVFSKANLSDIFEYMSEDESQRLFRLLFDKCRKGGRLAYWNLFVPRYPAKSVLEDKGVKPLISLSDTLHKEDGVFFWSTFYVDEVMRR